MEVSVGTPLAAAFTVNGTVPLVPAGVVTEMKCCPTTAEVASTRVAVTLVLLTADTFETVIPDPLALTVRGDTNPVPVSVTATDEP
jgi:hypothetical protein